MNTIYDDMEKDICPFCGKRQYITWGGDTVDVGTGGSGLQISPDMYECLYCGYEDQERCKYTEKQLMARHKRKIKKEIRLSRKWCDTMEKVITKTMKGN